MQDRHNKYRFPWQNDNSFRLLIDGPAFFSEMLKDIKAAQHYILLEMYLVNSCHLSQRFFQAMADASHRGVSVYLLLDDFGARGLNSRDRKYLRQHNIQLSFYNPLHLQEHKLRLFRDHRKLLVVDGYTAYVGGAGLIDEFDSLLFPQQNWRENMVRIQGPNVLQWQDLFVDNWARWSTIDIPLRTPTFRDMHQTGRVTITQGPRLMEIKRSFINHVRNAQRRVWMSTAYFAPSRKLRRTLRRTALRGIDVRLLIPGTITDQPLTRFVAQRYYSHLLRDGVRIFEYQPRFMHAKLVMCDNWVSLGSCNIDRWNMLWNLDANQEIKDSQFSSAVIDMFQADFANSKEILLEDWKKRSILTRIQIWFWAFTVRLVDTLLSRLRILRHWKRIIKRKR